VADTVRITIDGREIEAAAGSLLIQAAQDGGTYIPRFCWHPRMNPVGMCRMCLVEVEGPRGRMLTTACTNPVSDGMVVHTQSDTVKKAQEGVLEFLLINHPLDCPVCDRGGECPLQDQTMAYGPGESRFVEEKRHYPKPIPISDLVLLDRERCILCARCTRFSEEISGDPLIEFLDRGYGTQVNTFPDEPFASYFSGNTVQICPVGALTATPYRFRARPWDLEAVESTCPHCSVGCRISVQASQNRVLRFNGVDNDPTNQGWLCDKGRFGFEYLNAAERLRHPLVRGDDGELREAGWAEALDAAAAGLREVIDGRGADAVAGLGGARGTNEEAYAFGKFLRSAIGTPHLDAQLDDGLEAPFLTGVADRAVIDDLERARTVLVWGPDLKEELPVLYLRVRRAASELGATLIVVHPRRSGLDPVAGHTVRYRPGEGPEVLRRLQSGEGDLAPVREALGEGPVVAIVGRTGLAEDARLAEAVAAFVRDLPDARILPVARRSNVYGALDMGLSPGLLPGRATVHDEDAREALTDAWDMVPTATGRDAAGIVEGLEQGLIGALVLFGCDPAADFPDPARGAAALERAGFVIAVDLFLTESARRADVVFPVLGFAEVEGTVTNLEGRVQKVNRLLPGPGQSRPAWEVFEEVARRLGSSIGATSAETLAAEIDAVAPAYAGVTWESLDWGAGRSGVVTPIDPETAPPPYLPADAAPASRGADLVLHLARVLYDRGTTVAMGPSLAGLAAEPAVHLHPDDAARLGITAGVTVRLTGSGGSAELPAAVDPSLAPGTVYLPFNLGASVGNGLEVAVEAVDR
jgi:NADH-quinone oxidoreductase subunit G